jgi:hypothetical protein
MGKHAATMATLPQALVKNRPSCGSALGGQGDDGIRRSADRQGITTVAISQWQRRREDE